MTFKHMIDLLKTRGAKMDISDLGFMLTVLRDNVTDEEVHEILDEYVRDLSFRLISKINEIQPK